MAALPPATKTTSTPQLSHFDKQLIKTSTP